MTNGPEFCPSSAAFAIFEDVENTYFSLQVFSWLMLFQSFTLIAVHQENGLFVPLPPSQGHEARPAPKARWKNHPTNITFA